jgi:REP element-mobilizing transposase RayT
MHRATDPEAWHRPIRLREESYLGGRWYFVTICAFERRGYFRERSTAEWSLRILREECQRDLFLARAYCLMPDHLHLLVQGVSPNANLLRFVESFKARTTYRFWMRRRETLWQVSFYDHILRDEDVPGDVAWYIWMNPVRAELVKSAEEYAFSGPFVKDWDTGSGSGNGWRPPNSGGGVMGS